MSPVAVVMRNVCKAYNKQQVLEDVNLEVRKGEFFTLLGPSGCGKTTLLKLLAGLEMPTAGEILLDHVPITHLMPHLRNIGMVFQNYALFPHMTVAENIAFPLRMRKLSKDTISAKVANALRITQLDSMACRYPKQLSGGQQQRVALARAFVYDPTILLMDEPLGALDRNLRDQMRLELKRLQRRIHTTVLYVTHDQEEALSMSDRVGVMRNGKLLQVAEPSELYEHPASEFIARFIGESVTLAARVREAGESLVLTVDGISRPIFAPAAHALAVGDQVVLVLRPEKIALHFGPPPDALANWTVARVEDAVYLGQSVQVFARTPGGAKLMVRLPSTQSCPTVDQEVFLSWQSNHSRVVRD